MTTLPARFSHDAPVASKPIHAPQVHAAQQAWADAIVTLGQAQIEGAPREDLVALANDAIDRLYAYDIGPVLFKPTRAADRPFRATRDEARSYFIGGDIAEDHGFALQPWVHVEFRNDQIAPMGDTTLTMGTYIFTEAVTLKRVSVEYTFGYRRNADGEVRIHLHHSSLPFKPNRL
ncbi:MAG: hypothetical protein AAF663_07780 [Planctomycetota bacterium]